jgi:hypothetical protein
MLLSRGEICSSRRRQWSEDDKGRIVAESFERGVKASEVAGGVTIRVTDQTDMDFLVRVVRALAGRRA